MILDVLPTVCFSDCTLGQTNLISRSMDLFQNLKGQSVGKKRKIKKKKNFLHWL